MTPDDQRQRRGVDAYSKELKSDTQARLTEMTRLCAYYFRRYHDTRRALIGCRLDRQELEWMVENLQKQLGDKGLDVDLGNDIPDVK